MSTHTPGPWTVHEMQGGYRRKPCILIRGAVPRGRRIARLEVEDATDARLIAAAPELLEALEELREHLQERWQESGHEWHAEQESVKKASTALAKARGETA